MYNILIACTGSVASVKVPLLAEEFKKTGLCHVKVVGTDSAIKFIDQTMLDEIYDDKLHWERWENYNTVLHIELAKWADVICIAPLDANTLAKIAVGISDNVLLNAIRAFPLDRPVFFCPAMNVIMFDHPSTQEAIKKLQSFGYHCIWPIAEVLLCGDYGIGAMEKVDKIVKIVMAHLEKYPPKTIRT